MEAFNIVPEGLAIVDTDGKYVLFNKRFAEINDSAADAIYVGADFTDSLRTNLYRGHYLSAIGREEAWLAERLAGHEQEQYASEEHIRGDRWVRIEERRMEDGSRIGVRVDITDLKKREEALKQRTDQLLNAQTIGRMGDWSYRIGESEVQMSQQGLNLLGMNESVERLPIQVVKALVQQNEMALPPCIQSDNRCAGDICSQCASNCDVQVRRADGSLGDFMITYRSTVDVSGNVTGFSGVIQDISDRKIAERELERLAYRDPLTGLANRAMFQKKLNDVLLQCLSGGVAALLLIDLDRFKDVNDTLGHASGDELLQKVAARVCAVLGGEHFVARL
ncbi:MAG: diguanylate cyclase, partial [Chromatiales bacterium]|nr:diguanylate cyclase [Chromatiales bacterium]